MRRGNKSHLVILMKEWWLNNLFILYGLHCFCKQTCAKLMKTIGFNGTSLACFWVSAQMRCFQILVSKKAKVLILKALPILHRRHSVNALELFAQVGGSKTHRTGNLADGHFGLVILIMQQPQCLLQTNVVHILGKRQPFGILNQQLVERMTIDAETVAHILTLQSDVGVEALLADSRVNGYKSSSC